MRRLKYLTCAVILISILICSNLLLVKADDNSQNYISDTKILEAINHAKSGSKVKNFAVSLYHNGEISYLEGKEQELFMIGSMTKAFTGLGILYLENEGKLNLNDPVATYIPEFSAYYDANNIQITVQNLLEMKSGFTNSEKDYPSADSSMTLNDWMLSINGSELRYKPGETYSYSNTNYNLLGLIIERVSEESYKNFMENKILKPLGLNNTYCGKPLENKVICEGRRLGYGLTFPYYLEVKEGCIPAGYLYSNIEDMARWIRIQTGDEEIPEEYKKIIERSHEALTYGDNDTAYFAGWEKFGDNVLGHSGGTANYSSRIIFSLDTKEGVCVLSDLNAAASTDSLCNQIFSYISNGEMTLFHYDVWRVFDIIFTNISIAVIIYLILLKILKKKRLLSIIGGLFFFVTFVSFIIVLPLVFGSNLFEILWVWAPYSMSGGLVLMLVAVVSSLFFELKGHSL